MKTKININLLNKVFGSTDETLKVHENLYATGSESFIVIGKSPKKLNGYVSTSYNYILNRDGSLRWLIPNKAKKAYYLKFYNTQSLKAKSYALITHVFYALKLKSLLRTGVITHYKKEGALIHLDDYLNESQFNFSLFFGTKGPNQKIVLYTKSQEDESFTKIGINIPSINAVLQEKKNYKKLKGLNLKQTIIPDVLSDNKTRSVTISSICSKKSVRKGKITDAHIQTINEWYLLTLQKDNQTYVSQVAYDLDAIHEDSRIEGSRQMVSDLKKMFFELKKKTVATALAHGDFTPWNTYVNKNNKLVVYDFEAMGDYPLLFDLIHFIYQSNILVKKKSFHHIWPQVKQLETYPQIADILTKNKLTIEDCHHWYILQNTTNYLNLFYMQDSLHPQAFWLINTWKKAIEHSLNQLFSTSNKKQLLVHLFPRLEHKRYALLKANEQSPLEDHTHGDLDMVIHRDDAQHIIRWIKQYPSIAKIKHISTSYMDNLKLYFKDDTFLSIDFIYHFKRKEKVYLSAFKFFVNPTILEGIKYAEPRFDMEYIAKFYLLNGEKIPKKYMSFFKHHIATKSILKHLENSFNTNLNDFNELNTLKVKTEAIAKTSFKSMALYGVDTLKKMVYHPGKVITLSGVDGSGKTTVLTDLAYQLSSRYREEVVLLRHRPSILPILSSFKYGKKEAENRSVRQLPRKGKNKSTLLSYARFAYYLTDYVVGQVYIWFKYTARGKTVIYDRYYFDFISDPKRSNLKIHPIVAQWFYKLVFKPHVNVLLYAPSEVILQRKKELTKPVIESLTNNYLKLFRQLEKNNPQVYLSVNNLNQKETLNKIIRACLPSA